MALQAAGAPESEPFPLTTTLLYVAAFFAILYFFFILPAKRREEDEQSMLSKIKKNDHVVTRGGLYGVVMNVKDNEVVLRVDEQNNVKLRFQKSAIASIVEGQSKSPKK